MIRNNISSIVYHIFISTLNFFAMFFIGFNSSLPRSEQERLARLSLENFKSWTIFLVTIILYFVFGLFLKSYKSKFKNFLSVSLISFIGLLIMFIDLLRINTIFSFKVAKYYYVFASFNITAIGNTKRFNNSNSIIICIIFILIPSLAIWLGIEFKKKLANDINSSILSRDRRV